MPENTPCGLPPTDPRPATLEDAIRTAPCQRLTTKHPECVAAAVRTWLTPVQAEPAPAVP